MTLHQSIEAAKKFLIGVTAGIVIVIILSLLFQFGKIIKNIFFPAKTLPANHLYDKLPAVTFPQNITSDKLTYKLNTLTGTLPEFPDRLEVFKIQQSEPNFLNLDKAKQKASKLGFVTDQGTVSQETNLGHDTYQWTYKADIQKKFIMNIITFNFSLTSNYLSSTDVIDAKNIRDATDAINTTKSFLEGIGQPSSDINFDKTAKAKNDTPYYTQPQLFSVEDGVLNPTTSLSKTQVIRVDLYQKNMTYSLDTGVPQVTGGYKKLDIDLPILYPRPPYSTMSFWVASGGLFTQVYAANFIHQSIQTPDPTAEAATYPIKTSQEAFDELTKGKAYIAAYSGFDKTIKINNVYLAYYLGEDPQQYLTPIIVFEGDNGFFAYVSAVRDEWTQQK